MALGSLPNQVPSCQSPLRREISAIAARFEAADRRAKRADTLDNREAAEAERREAAGDFWAAEIDLADLLFILLRLAIRHRPAALAQYLKRAMETELNAVADAIVQLEGRR
jgi:hypothetical protein